MITNEVAVGSGTPWGAGARPALPTHSADSSSSPAPDLLLVPSSTPSRVPGMRPDTWPSLKMRAAGPRRAAGCPGIFRLRSKTRRVVSLSLARASYIALATASLRGPAWPRRRPCGNPGCCGSGSVKLLHLIISRDLCPSVCFSVCSYDAIFRCRWVCLSSCF